MKHPSSTSNARLIQASPEAVYAAFTDPEALATWQAPGNMTARVHDFDLREGGGYTMSLYYPSSEKGTPGKTAGHEDRYTARFVELVPSRRIVQTVTFDSDNPDFAGEMEMEVILEPQGTTTNVTIAFRNIPPGIDPKDNEAGTESSLQKLAQYVERTTESS